MNSCHVLTSKRPSLNSLITLDNMMECTAPGCTKSIGRPENLRRHVESVHNYGEKLFGCPVDGCGKRFHGKEHLESHMAYKHLNLSRFECAAPGCPWKFVAQKDLDQHVANMHFPRLRIIKKVQDAMGTV